MAVVEVVLGALVALAGGGAGWIGRGKYDAAQREANKKVRVPSERRKAGAQKAAATRKANAEKKVLEQQDKQVDVGLVQKQQFQGQPNGAANGQAQVGDGLYGRAEL